MDEEVAPVGVGGAPADDDRGPVQYRQWDVAVGIALPYAEVAVLGRGGETSEIVKGSLGLLYVGRVALGDVDVPFRLAGPGGIGDEAQPGRMPGSLVGRK
jgi:hypothetical protein